MGTGKYGEESDNRIVFPKKPYLVVIHAGNFGGLMIIQRNCPNYVTLMAAGFYGGTITWTGNTMSWQVGINNAEAQFNGKGTTYYVLALLASNE